MFTHTLNSKHHLQSMSCYLCSMLDSYQTTHALNISQACILPNIHQFSQHNMASSTYKSTHWRHSCGHNHWRHRDINTYIFKRHNFQHKYTYERYYNKTSFPIVLAYAMTGHKSEGATISTTVIVNILNASALRVSYVI